MSRGKRISPFVKSNPLYEVATTQNFANEKIEFKPIIDVLELLFGNVAFGNFFINVIDFRDFTYPYNSSNSINVVGHSAEGKDLNWLMTVLHPEDLPVFLEYGGLAIGHITRLPEEKKKRSMFNHCYRIRHGLSQEYIWLYQQHHMSHLDGNGAIVYSISFITDVTHLLSNQLTPSWSVIEKAADGTSTFLTGSLKNIPGDRSISLSSREKDILSLVAKGYPSRLIAIQLRISYETVITHKKNILRKTKSQNISEAIAYALNLGFL